jgi:hypothetical protein
MVMTTLNAPFIGGLKTSVGVDVEAVEVEDDELEELVLSWSAGLPIRPPLGGFGSTMNITRRPKITIPKIQRIDFIVQPYM